MKKEELNQSRNSSTSLLFAPQIISGIIIYSWKQLFSKIVKSPAKKRFDFTSFCWTKIVKFDSKIAQLGLQRNSLRNQGVFILKSNDACIHLIKKYKFSLWNHDSFIVQASPKRPINKRFTSQKIILSTLAPSLLLARHIESDW